MVPPSWTAFSLCMPSDLFLFYNMQNLVINIQCVNNKFV